MLACAGFVAAQDYLDIRRYNNIYEINILPGRPPKPGDGYTTREMNKCQAVRLSKEWFITSKHCFENSCGIGGCTVQARLLVGPSYEMVWQVYASSILDDVIRIYQPSGADKDNIAYDIALVKFPEGKAEHIFFAGPYRGSDPAFLEQFGVSSMDIGQAISGGNFPKLLLLKAETPKVLNRHLAVVSKWGSSAEVLASYGPVYYSPQKHYLFTDNFGIRSGISGSGVFTSSGELVGVVSATGYLKRGASAGDLNYTFLTVFNEDVLGFINRNVGRVDSKTSDMSYMGVIPEDNRPLVFGVIEAIT